MDILFSTTRNTKNNKSRTGLSVGSGEVSSLSRKKCISFSQMTKLPGVSEVGKIRRQGNMSGAEPTLRWRRDTSVFSTSSSLNKKASGDRLKETSEEREVD